MKILAKLLEIPEVKEFLADYYDFDESEEEDSQSTIVEDDYLDIIENDYEAGRIKGELIAVEVDPFINVGIITCTNITYVDENRRIKKFDIAYLKEFAEQLVSLILEGGDFDKCLRERAFLMEVEQFCGMVANIIERNEDISILFTMNSKQEWNGTLTELAEQCIQKTQNKTYRNLAKACRETVGSFTIERKSINYHSLYSLARQIRSGNRF